MLTQASCLVAINLASPFQGGGIEPYPEGMTSPSPQHS